MRRPGIGGIDAEIRLIAVQRDRIRRVHLDLHSIHAGLFGRIQKGQRPLKALAAALALLLVLRLLGSVLGALDGVPLLPRLLQLVGLIWIGLYSSRNLVRSDSRQQLLAKAEGVWSSVVGRAD